jgi:2-methylisocitrate lyase-like PEP mutase family enzyme
MSTQQEKADLFLSLHQPGRPLRLPNAWDPGSAKLLESLGARALATTSGGHAATLGKMDGTVSREECLAHASAVVQSTDLPVSADLENCYSDAPDGVAATIRAAVVAGLAGCSVEDSARNGDSAIYELALATDRVAAAAEAAHGPVRIVLTARAENLLHGRLDLADTIARLQAFGEAGADVLYAPGLTKLEDIAEVVRSIDLPLNVLALAGGPDVDELAELGVARVSVGSAFAYVALGAGAQAAREFLGEGTKGYFAAAALGRADLRAAFKG